MATKNRATSLAGWKKNKTHYPMLPSGTRVGIQVPDLPSLLAGGDIPQPLIEKALADGPDATPDPETIKQQNDFQSHLVKVTVVEPKLTDEDIKELPYEDISFIVEIATRQRDVDALGEHIGGLPATSDQWAAFREGDGSDEAVEGS